MDDYNVNVLSEAKNEYSSRLVSTLTPLLIQGIKSIFNEAVNLCKDNDENEKYLMTFQNFLSRVPKWNENISLHENFKGHLTSNEFIVKRNKWLKKKLETKKNVKDIQSVRTLTEILYEKAYNSIDIIKILENNSFKKENKFLFLIYFDKIRSQFRDEKLLMLTILNLFFLRKNLNLENILEM